MNKFVLDIDTAELKKLLKKLKPDWRQHEVLADFVGINQTITTNYLPRIGETIFYPCFSISPEDVNPDEQSDSEFGVTPEDLYSFLCSHIRLKVVDILHAPVSLDPGYEPSDTIPFLEGTNIRKTIVLTKPYWV